MWTKEESPEQKSLIVDIIKYSFLVNGLTYTYNNFGKLIPVPIWKELKVDKYLYNIMDKLTDPADTVDILNNDIIDRFIKNNIKDNTLIPVVANRYITEDEIVGTKVRKTKHVNNKYPVWNLIKGEVSIQAKKLNREADSISRAQFVKLFIDTEENTKDKRHFVVLYKEGEYIDDAQVKWITFKTLYDSRTDPRYLSIVEPTLFLDDKDFDQYISLNENGVNPDRVAEEDRNSIQNIKADMKESATVLDSSSLKKRKDVEDEDAFGIKESRSLYEDFKSLDGKEISKFEKELTFNVFTDEHEKSLINRYGVGLSEKGVNEQHNKLKSLFEKHGVSVTLTKDGTLDDNASVEQLEDGTINIKYNPAKVANDSIYHEHGHIYTDLIGYNDPFIQSGINQLRDT